jgi:hypothetical protein
MVEGEDEKPVQKIQAQDGPRTNGSKSHDVRRNTSGQKGDGHVNGMEWESKWAKETRPQKEIFRDNLEVKVDTIVSLVLVRYEALLTIRRRWDQHPRILFFLRLSSTNAITFQ